MPENTVTLVGNLTRDPELRITPQGKSVAHLSLAVNRRYQQDGEWKTVGSFFEVRAWDQLAENICSSLHQGNRVTVTGRLDYRTWEKDDGTKGNATEVVADDVAASLRFDTVVLTKTGPHGSGTRPAGQPDATTGEAREFDDSPF